MAAPSRIEFKLNDHATFYIRKYEPFLALEILGDLQTKFLSPLAAFLEGNDQDVSQETRMKYITDGIERLSRTLDGKSLVAISRTVLNGEYVTVVIDNDPPEKLSENLLNRSVDNVGEVFVLLAEVLKVNFAEVFTLAMSRIGGVREQVALN